MRARHRIAPAACVALGLAATPAAGDLPVGWEVEIFAGAIVDMVAHDGVIAAATDGGLLLYDVASEGSAQPRFEQIADAGCQGARCLRSNALTAIDVDENGALWVGTRSSGVSSLRRDAGGFQYRHFFRANAPESALLADSVLALDALGDEAVYVATTSGIAQIDLAGSLAEYNDVASRVLGINLPATVLHDVAADSTHVWVASDLGVLRYTRLPDYDVRVLADSLTSTRVNVVEIFDAVVYIGTDDGVYRWNEGGEFWDRIRNVPGAPNPTPDFPVYSLARLEDPTRDRFVAGSNSEVWLFQGSVWGRCSPPTLPLLGPRRFPAMVARGDSVWTSQSDGVGRGAYLERFVFSQGCGSWKRFEPNAIPPTAVNDVDLTRDRQQLWVALQAAGVARRSADGTWCAFNSNDSTVAANMTVPVGGAESFRIDRGGSAWFSNLPSNAQAPVDRLDADPSCQHANDVWDHVQPGEFGFGGRYWKIEVDGVGNRFFLSDENAASPGGVDVLSPDLSQWLNVRDDVLGGKAVGAITFLSTSGPWTTAYLGVNNLGGDGLVLWRASGDIFGPPQNNFFQSQPLGSRTVTAYRDIVYHARHGHLWIGTDAGLMRYDVADRVVTAFFDEKSDLTELGLLGPGISDLLLDDRDNLWVGTANGLNRISVADTAIVQIEAFTTREKIEELNSRAGEFLYREEFALAPLPRPEVESLAYDEGRNHLHVATRAGLARLDVEAFDAGPSIPIEQAVVYPNPIRPLNPADPLDPTAQIFVDNVTTPATIVIYNLEGQVVSMSRLEETGGVAWDLKIAVNEPGAAQPRFFKATSGVYLVRIESPTGSTVTPLVVIR